MSKPLLALEATLLSIAFIAALANAIAVATALIIGAGLVVVMQKWRD